MRRYAIFTALAAALTLGAPLAHAGDRDLRAAECRKDARNCQPTAQNGDTRHLAPERSRHDQQSRKEVRQSRGDERRAPRIGDDAREGQAYLRGKDSRLAAPPRGQEYRVLRDQIVLVDQKTKRIVNVVGPVSGTRR